MNDVAVLTQHRPRLEARRPNWARRGITAGRCARWWVATAVVCVVLAVAPAEAISADRSDHWEVAQGSGEPEPGTRPSPESLPPLPDNAGDILPYPNSGVEPTHAGDRGGWLQTLVLVTMLGGLGVVGTFAWRDAKRKREAASRPLP